MKIHVEMMFMLLITVVAGSMYLYVVKTQWKHSNKKQQLGMILIGIGLVILITSIHPSIKHKPVFILIAAYVQFIGIVIDKLASKTYSMLRDEVCPEASDQNTDEHDE